MLKIKGYKAPSGTQYYLAARAAHVSYGGKFAGLDVTAYLKDDEHWPVGNDTFVTLDEIDNFLLTFAFAAERLTGLPNVLTQAVSNQRRNKKGAGVLHDVSLFVANCEEVIEE